MPGTYSASGAIPITVNGSSDKLDRLHYFHFLRHAPRSGFLNRSVANAQSPVVLNSIGNYLIYDGFDINGLNGTIDDGVTIHGYYTKVINSLVHDNGAAGWAAVQIILLSKETLFGTMRGLEPTSTVV